MNRLQALLADPVRTSIAVGALVAAGGFVVLFATWQRMNDVAIVAGQLPFVVSGGLTALAMVIFGVGAALLQAARRANARTRAELTAFADSLDELVAVVQGRRGGRPTGR